MSESIDVKAVQYGKDIDEARRLWGYPPIPQFINCGHCNGVIDRDGQKWDSPDVRPIWDSFFKAHAEIKATVNHYNEKYAPKSSRDSYLEWRKGVR